MSTNVILGGPFKEQLVTGDKAIVDVNGRRVIGPEGGGAVTYDYFNLSADGGVLFSQASTFTIKVKASTITSESSFTVTDPTPVLTSYAFNTDGDGYRVIDIVLINADGNATLEWTWNDVNFILYIDAEQSGG